MTTFKNQLKTILLLGAMSALLIAAGASVISYVAHALSFGVLFGGSSQNDENFIQDHLTVSA